MDVVQIPSAVGRWLGFSIGRHDYSEAWLPLRRTSQMEEKELSDEDEDAGSGEEFGCGTGVEDPHTGRHNCEFLLRALEVRALLRPGATLQQAVTSILKLLSYGEALEVVEVLQDLERRLLGRLPSRTSLARSAHKLDMATLLWRQHSLAAGWRTIGSLAVDASEQKTTNYLLSRYEYVSLPEKWSIAERLENDWSPYYCTTHLPPGVLG